MVNNYIKVQLVSVNQINVVSFSDIPRPDNQTFTLFIEDKPGIKLNLIRSVSLNNISIFELELKEPYQFGLQYSLAVSSNVALPVDISSAVDFPEFGEMFNYDGDDLGATYTKEKTTFALWAPLATQVLIKVYDKKAKRFLHHNMIRGDKGVYRYEAIGDFENCLYGYHVTNNGVTRFTTDPYAKACNANNEYSAVIDFNKITSLGKIKPTNQLKNYVDHIIYEVNVRDFTEQENTTNIKNKGKYLGFVEKNCKTNKGNACGLDYLINLGITTVQLNPIIDFGSVDELNVDKKYNWGYDPISFFNIEGSYSTNPNDPINRLIEFKTMINKLHECNIRVVIDVVYNHIYEYLSSCYEKIVPNYYFRRARNGNIANASGCGDDVASEKFMVRKMIIDSLKYFVDAFDVDGFRFDLMGLIDIKTLSDGLAECKTIKKDIIFYGEGWNMGSELAFEEKGCSENAQVLPDFGFFNETVRDVIKGSTFNLNARGYAGGDVNYSFGIKYLLYGCTADVSYSKKYLTANQSINYIECHDNHTLYDKLTASNENEDPTAILKLIKFANGILLTLPGVTFLHMGQEIGLSKRGNGNSYNVLKVNMMDWNLVDERYEMVHYLKCLIEFRKTFKLYSLFDPNDLLQNIQINEFSGLLTYTVTNPDLIGDYKEICVIYNPNSKPVPLTLDDEYCLILDQSGHHFDNHFSVRYLMVGPNQMGCVVKR